MNRKLTCTMPQEAISYDIEILRGALQHGDILAKYISTLGSRCAIITDDKVAPLYGSALLDALKTHLKAQLFVFPNGEQYKTRQTKEQLENQMFEMGMGRDTCLVALGGGVVSDMGGYIAATYCRGIPLVMIPTTLLGMVDASIGGKNGVDVPFGKNLIGSIYQPKKIVIDSDCLKTLPVTEVRNGIVEMIKHGFIADSAHYDYLNSCASDILSLNLEILEKAIEDSCRIKLDIISNDEKENGRRHLVNFGHTIGHALENVTQYAISHGEAVAIGMLVESEIACQLGHMNRNALTSLQNILKRYGLLLRLPGGLKEEPLIKAMTLDKKSLNGMPRFVMMKEIGSPLHCNGAFCDHADPQIIKSALKWMLHDLCRH